MSKKTAVKEADNVYFLKILIYFVLGTIWIKFNIGGDSYPVIPVGGLLGIIIAQKDHFAIDRKVEYATLIIAGALGLAGWGLYLA